MSQHLQIGETGVKNPRLKAIFEHGIRSKRPIYHHGQLLIL
jgi:hypothetical protein